MQERTASAEGLDLPYEVVADADADRGAWLEARRSIITATDVASIIGVPGARHSLETFYLKQGALGSRAIPEQERLAKEAGVACEHANAMLFEANTGRQVRRDQRLIRSKRWPWLGCTLDYTQQRALQSPTILAPTVPFATLPLELKNAGGYVAEEMWAPGDEPHLTWQVQLQTQMLVMGVDAGSLSALLGSPFVHHKHQDFDRDEELSAIILDETETFWKKLRCGTAPVSDGSVAAMAALKRLAPSRIVDKPVKLTKSAIDIDAGFRLATERVERARAEAREAETMLEEWEAKIVATIGEHTSALLPNGVVYQLKTIHNRGHVQEPYSYRLLKRVAPEPSKGRR